MPAHRQFDGVGNRFATGKAAAHAFVTHCDSIGHGDCCEFARGSVCGFNPKFHGLGLAVQRDVARCRLIPAGCDANQRLVNLVLSQTHRVEIGAVWRALRPFGYMPAG